jgi:hypothetical protein
LSTGFPHTVAEGQFLRATEPVTKELERGEAPIGLALHYELSAHRNADGTPAKLHGPRYDAQKANQFALLHIH